MVTGSQRCPSPPHDFSSFFFVKMVQFKDSGLPVQYKGGCSCFDTFRMTSGAEEKQIPHLGRCRNTSIYMDSAGFARTEMSEISTKAFEVHVSHWSIDGRAIGVLRRAGKFTQRRPRIFQIGSICQLIHGSRLNILDVY